MSIWRTAPASRANKPTQHPFPTMSVEAIVGVWSCRKEGTCACGYVGDWRIVSLPDEELRCEELPGQLLLWIYSQLLPKARPLGSSNGVFRAGEVGGDIGLQGDLA